MSKLVLFLSILLIGEVLNVVVFKVIKGYYNPEDKRVDFHSLVKGNLERLFIFLSLTQGLPQALIVFGALKIGTRLKSSDNQISNDYFLVGNLVSLTTSTLYYMLYNLLLNG
ncbi:MAG: hypothetical protein RJQ09_10795 [Cyclobacteriaceae bacterium]